MKKSRAGCFVMMVSCLLMSMTGCGTAEETAEETEPMQTTSEWTEATETTEASETTADETAAVIIEEAEPVEETFVIPAGEITQAMGAGWNLGNQLESAEQGTPEETLWGNPVVTHDLIKAVADAGFQTVRIPVSYLDKIDAENHVDEAWLNRVQEVINYCYAEGLYVIINLHGDGYHTINGGWLLVDAENQEDICQKYEAVWRQIAEHFAAYDEHLIFESMNEVFDGSYGEPNRTYYDNLNRYNQIFVDTVRSSGGQNDHRYLMVNGWNTSIQYTLGDYGFTMPSDAQCGISENRLMLSVHFYDPWDYCGDVGSKTYLWGAKGNAMIYGLGLPEEALNTGGSEDYLDEQFQWLYDDVVSEGIPVVLGEYGAIDKSHLQPEQRPAILSNRIYYDAYVAGKAAAMGIVPIYWDNGYNGTNGFALFDRRQCIQTQPEVISAIITAVQEKNPMAGMSALSDKLAPQ